MNDDYPDPIAPDAPTPEEADGDTVRVPGTRLGDVVAVTHDGEVLCLDCAAEDYVDLCRDDPRQIPYGGPVDRGTEWDCPGPTCGNCHRRIESVTVLHYDGVCQPGWCDEIDTEEEPA